jgi:hypothetical protein
VEVHTRIARVISSDAASGSLVGDFSYVGHILANPAPTTDDFTDIRDDVVKLRAKGYGVDRISKMLGLSKKRVDNIIHSEFVARFGNRQEMIVQTAMTLNMLMRPLLDKFEKDAEAGRPDRRDVETVLKVIDTKRRLFALDAPVKMEITHIEQLSDEQLNAELAKFGLTTATLATIPAALPAATKAAETESITDAEYTTVDEPVLEEATK